MKKTLFIITPAFFSFAFAQSASSEVISSGGNHYENTSMQMSWTLGEPATETYVSGSNQITQGFHQTNLSIASVENLDPLVNLEVYPNPTVNFLSVDVSENALGSTIQLFDEQGREIYTGELKDVHSTIDFTPFAVGSYFLKLTNTNGNLINVSQIQKMH